MALDADCGVSTVLEEIRVESTARFLVRGECWVPLRNSATPTVGSRRRMPVAGRQIRNSKFEIRNQTTSVSFFSVAVPVAVAIAIAIVFVLTIELFVGIGIG